MCTSVHAQTLYVTCKTSIDTIVQLSEHKPAMLASSVLAVVACTATALRVLHFIVFQEVCTSTFKVFSTIIKVSV